MIRFSPIVGFIFGLFFALNSFAAEYDIDNAHSSVGFKIRHLVGRVPGKFTEYKGTLSYDPKKVKASKVKVEIATKSINTDNAKRDDHLRSPDFFNVEKFPEIKFVSKEVTDVRGKTLRVKGDFTMLGVTKPVTLDVVLGGEGVDPWGNKKTGFSATTKINRKDFGMVWNKKLDAGGVLLGDEVDVIIEIEANQKS